MTAKTPAAKPAATQLGITQMHPAIAAKLDEKIAAMERAREELAEWIDMAMKVTGAPDGAELRRIGPDLVFMHMPGQPREADQPEK